MQQAVQDGGGDDVVSAEDLSPLVEGLVGGSPPHAWGQSTSAISLLLWHRFTPTRVGTMLVDLLRAIDAYGSPCMRTGYAQGKTGKCHIR